MTTDTGDQAHQLLVGAIDAHVHGAPDIFERRMSVLELAEDAVAHGMAGIVILNHFSDTAPQAAIVDSHVDSISVRGGIKLNRPCGGLNPDAVEVALDLGAVKVDMPTQDAANELRCKGKDPTQGITVMDGGDLHPKVHDILSLVSKSGATISTGHLSEEAVQAVVEAAFDHGIQHPVISHPTLPSVNLPVEKQVELADQGAMVEYCYVNTTDVLRSHYPDWEPLNVSDILEQAAAVGHDGAILATDFGQPENPNPTEGFRDFIAAALEFGFTECEVFQMVRHNPRSVYDFDL